MKLYVLKYNEETSAYEREGYIDDCESQLWIKRFTDAGECEIYTQINDEVLNLLKVGNYIYRTDDTMVCEIKELNETNDVENGPYIIAKGVDIVKLMGERIVRVPIGLTTTPSNFVKKIIEDNLINDPASPNRLFSNLEVDITFTDTDTIVMSVFTENIFDLIKSICETYNIGFKMTFDVNKQTYKFIMYKGKNKSKRTDDEYVVFSPENSNILSSNYNESTTDYKNVAYVGYQKDDKSEVQLYSVYIGDKEPEGKDRKEIYVDGTSIKQNIPFNDLVKYFPNATPTSSTSNQYTDGIGNTVIGVKSGDTFIFNAETYYSLIRNLGYNTLAEHNMKRDFQGVVDTSDNYIVGVDYDLGDVVKVIDDFHNTGEARITEIMESDDIEDGYVVEPTYKYIK